MSDAKHTPGPWIFAPLEWRGEPTPDGLGYIRPQDEDGKEICHHGDTDRSGEENVANARLIAAAPDLLDFAETVSRLTEYDCSNMDGSDMEDALHAVNSLIRYSRAAIAKATGAA